jgi:hypothetical protein
MSNEDRYYYITPLLSDRQLPRLMKWNETFNLTVEENVEWRQCFELTSLKSGDKDTEKPKSDKYTRYKPVIRETFLDHYSLALKYLHETALDEGEFYLYEHSNRWFEILYFSKDEKQRRSIEIDFRDFIDNLWLMFLCVPGHSGRPSARKKAVAIPVDRFKQFLNLTIQYLYDPDSLAVYLGDYIKNFKQLIKGDTKIEGFIISGEKATENILNQLEARKDYLEKRLIENDSDSVNERLKLRGELEGIGYAIKVVKSS